MSSWPFFFLYGLRGYADEVTRVTFASRLRTLRRARGLTLQQLGANTQIHHAQLSRYENGLLPSIDSIVRIAQALDVDPRDLAEPVIASASANSPARSTVVA